MKYVYDKKKKEYVLAEGRRVISGKIIYKTTKSAFNAKLYPDTLNDSNLKRLEKTLGYEQGTLEIRSADEAMIENYEKEKSLDDISQKQCQFLDKYGWSTGNLKALLQSLDKLYELDFKGIDDMILEEIYDEWESEEE